VGHSAALKHIRVDKEIDTEAALVRIQKGLDIEGDQFEDNEDVQDEKLNCMIYLVSSSRKSGQHLRILAHLAEMIDSADFCERWMGAKNEKELREILLRDERFINILLKRGDITESMIGKSIREIELPGESLVTIIKRDGQIIFPHGHTVLQENDELSIIGEKSDIRELKKYR
jgi:NhaP-type Na+/H+ and K+/H+ antiporter